MLCHVCQLNKATVHLTQIIDGNIKKVDLCEGCSKQKGVEDPTGFSLTDLLLGLGSEKQEEQEDTEVKNHLHCASCGYSEFELNKNGRVGCPNCYKVFKEGLEQLLKTMHKGVKHSGKVPVKLQAKRDYHLRIHALEERLNEAVLSERYEEAATLRDELKQIRQDFPRAESEV